MKKIMFNDRYCLTQAVIEGRKTMTRRIIGGYPLLSGDRIDEARFFAGFIQIVANDGETLLEVKSRYKVGEVVAVAQSYSDVAKGGYPVDSRYDAFRTANWGDGEDGALKSSAGWNNKMFVIADLMPHHIRITGVHCERLQDISEEDCMKEGVYRDYGDTEFPPHEFYDYDGNKDNGFNTPREAFASLIDKVSGKGTWERNPWVIVYAFELMKPRYSM